jgi:pimeloyl-ACP methyl ester carboxylesterase
VDYTAQPTLLFLHGFLGSADDFAACMDALSCVFRCVAVDLPGHGATTVRQSCHGDDGPSMMMDDGPSMMMMMSIEATAEALATAVRALRLDVGALGCV